jgi:hypothetical protein
MGAGISDDAGIPQLDELKGHRAGSCAAPRSTPWRLLFRPTATRLGSEGAGEHPPTRNQAMRCPNPPRTGSSQRIKWVGFPTLRSRGRPSVHVKASESRAPSRFLAGKAGTAEDGVVLCIDYQVLSADIELQKYSLSAWQFDLRQTQNFSSGHRDCVFARKIKSYHRTHCGYRVGCACMQSVISMVERTFWCGSTP